MLNVEEKDIKALALMLLVHMKAHLAVPHSPPATVQEMMDQQSHFKTHSSLYEV